MPVQEGRLEDGFRSVRRIGALAFLREGPRAVVRYSLYGSLELWDGVTGHKIRTLRGDSDRETPIAFSPDGTRIASGGRWISADAAGQSGMRIPITVWDAATGNVVHTFDGHDRSIYTLAFSPDGNRLVSGGERGSVKVWDVRTRSLIRELGLGMERAAGPVTISTRSARSRSRLTAI
jgi:WD40 repeat protein